MDDSDLSSLSSAQSIETDDEILRASRPAGTLDRYFKQKPNSVSPPTKRKRPASPPHEYVLADNPDIAVSVEKHFFVALIRRIRVTNTTDAQFIVMFRSRFHAAFPKSTPNFGPQDVERGVEGSLPDEGIEKLLCALLGLVLNRKKDVE